MLNPVENRLDYSQILAPLDGYELDFAIGTTYSLDFEALIGACVALGLSAETDSKLLQDPVYLLSQLKQIENKVVLFCEGGQIQVPNRITSLYMLFEKIVYQVNVKKIENYSFHPKFWLIRYKKKNEDEFTYRLVVLSRNLTFDRSWDIAFCIDGEVKSKPTAKTINKTTPIKDFLSYLVSQLSNNKNLSSTEKRKDITKKIEKIQKELACVDFKLDLPFNDFDFLPVGIDNYDKNKLVTSYFMKSFDELLIISPFLSTCVIEKFLDNANKTKNAKIMLFTRSMSLNKIKQFINNNKKFRVFVMKDSIIDGESQLSEEGSQIQNQDIHAKLYMVCSGDITYLYLGSLNASKNALNGNIEFMIRLKTDAKNLNMNILSKLLFNYNKLKKDTFNPFEEVICVLDEKEDENEKKRNELNQLLKNICRLDIKAKVIFKDEQYKIVIDFPIQKLEKGKETITISPLFLNNESKLVAKTIEFNSLLLLQLSEFYKISIENEDNNIKIERVISIPTEGMPKNTDREQAVISAIINDKNNFLKYLSFALGENYILSVLENRQEEKHSEITKNGKTNIQFPALYEKILQVVATNPEKFAGIYSTMELIPNKEIVPVELEEIFEVVKEAINEKVKKRVN